MSKKAGADALEGLHGLVCEVLKAKLMSDECKPADISNAIKFLKDNGIEQIPTADNEIGNLLANLPFDKLEDVIEH